MTDWENWSIDEFDEAAQHPRPACPIRYKGVKVGLLIEGHYIPYTYRAIGDDPQIQARIDAYRDYLYRKSELESREREERAEKDACGLNAARNALFGAGQ